MPCATDSSSCGFCDGTIADGKCWDWVQPVDREYEDYGADAVEASMTMKLSAPESIGEPLEEVVGVALGVDACVQLDDGARNKGCRAAHDDDVTITVTADLDADVDLITAAVTFDVREDDDAGDGSLSVKVGDDDVFSIEASVDAPDAVEGVGRTCFFTAFDANMRGFFGSEDMYSDMSMGMAFDDFAWFDAELADSEASMAMTGAGLGEGFTVSTWDADATQGTVDRAACDAVVDIEVSLFAASPEKRDLYDVVTGAATFSGITVADANTPAARAVFQDAIARVAGVDADRVTILSVSAAARRRLTDAITVEFEIRAKEDEAAGVNDQLLAAAADPTIVDAALVEAVDAAVASTGAGAGSESGSESGSGAGALDLRDAFADVKTESFSVDVTAAPTGLAPPAGGKDADDGLALWAVLLIVFAAVGCACVAAGAAYYHRDRLAALANRAASPAQDDGTKDVRPRTEEGGTCVAAVRRILSRGGREKVAPADKAPVATAPQGSMPIKSQMTQPQVVQPQIQIVQPAQPQIQIIQPQEQGSAPGQLPTASKFCTNCGNPLAADAAFCGNCGQAV